MLLCLSAVLGGAEDSASDLEAELDGTLLRTGTGGVDPAMLLWNGLQHGPSPYIPPAQPGWVVLANSTRDASLAAQFALDNRVKLYARGKGHHYAGVPDARALLRMPMGGGGRPHPSDAPPSSRTNGRGRHHSAPAGVCLANDGMTVDLSRLTGVQIDVPARVARIEAGAAAGQVIYPANAQGLWAPVANIDGGGLAGFLLAGRASRQAAPGGVGGGGRWGPPGVGHGRGRVDTALSVRSAAAALQRGRGRPADLCQLMAAHRAPYNRRRAERAHDPVRPGQR